MRLLDIAYWLLVPAPLVFAMREALGLQALDPGTATKIGMAVAGICSGIALVLVIIAAWRTNHRAPAIIAVAIALSGHYIVSDFWSNGGGAMVYLGTGMAAWIRNPRALWVGALVAAFAILRGIGPAGSWLFIPAALWFAWELSVAARDRGTHIPPEAVPA